MVRPEDAKKKMKLSERMAAQKTVQHNNVLPVKQSILEEIGTNIKDIIISVTYVSNKYYCHNYNKVCTKICSFTSFLIKF